MYQLTDSCQAAYYRQVPDDSAVNRANAVPIDDREERMGYLLWRAQHACERRLLAVLAPFGMTVAHFGLLRQLELVPGITGAEIARRMDVTPQTVSAGIGEAKKRGWVSASQHPVHRSLVPLELTAEGREMLARAREPVLGMDRLFAEVFDEDERRTLRSLLLRLRNHMKTDAAP